MRAPRVLLADDHAPIHGAVRRIVEPEFRVVAAVFDGWALVEAVPALDPDVLILDVSMPGLDGFGAIELLTERGALPPAVVFLSEQRSAGLAERALELGAHAYVVKTSAADDLLPAIRSALAGRTFLSPTIQYEPRPSV